MFSNIRIAKKIPFSTVILSDNTQKMIFILRMYRYLTILWPVLSDSTESLISLHSYIYKWYISSFVYILYRLRNVWVERQQF